MRFNQPLPVLYKCFLWALYQVDVWNKWISDNFHSPNHVSRRTSKLTACLHFFINNKYVVRKCTSWLDMHTRNLWGLKRLKIYNQGMSRYTASELDHIVGCWPFYCREISKTQGMNIFLEAGRPPPRSFMGVSFCSVLWEDAGFSPYSVSQITQTCTT